MSEQTTLAWLESPGQPRRYVGDEALIGRAARADIRLASPSVSRYHALLRRADQRWVIADLGSANGTFVNGRRLGAPECVSGGDSLWFGEIEAVFRESAAAWETAPTRPELVGTNTASFALHYHADSFAATQSGGIGERLEAYQGALLDLVGPLAPDARCAVYLAEVPPEPPPGATLTLAGGFADASRQLLAVVYRADAPGLDLERLLLALIRQRAQASGLSLTDPLCEALHLLALQRLARCDPQERRDQLCEALAQGVLPQVAELFGATPGDGAEQHAPALADFLAYLRQRHGDEALRQFLRACGVHGPGRAARQVFGLSLAKIERRWRNSLRAATPDGVRLFLRIAGPYLRPHRRQLIELLAYLLAGIGFGIFLAKAHGLLLDRALLTGNRRVFAQIMVALVLAFVVTNLTSLREGYLRAQVSELLQRDLRLRMFSKVQELHPGFFRRMESGDIIVRMTGDLFLVESVLTSGLTELIRLSLTLVATFATLLLINWQLALLTIAGVPIFFLVGNYLGPPIARASLDRQQQLAEVTTAIQENLGLQPVIKAFNLQAHQTARFGTILATLIRRSLRLFALGSCYNVATSALAGATELAMLGVGGYLVFTGNLSAGELLTFVLLVGQVIGPMESLANLQRFVAQGTGSLVRVQELVDADVELRDGPDARPLPPLRRAIEFRDVAFDYDGTRPILRGLDLTIPAGQSVAIVGPSGCGKSTALNLLMRLYDPSGGQIRIDGHDLREATLESVRGQFGVVFQESVLFDLSIRENIRLGNPAASDGEVEAAARAAELHDLVGALPAGYDTLVGERGGQLSGGQRQRVALARALIRNPTVLLLDEATSALDPQTEAAIAATLRRLSHGRTIISVTHRLASARHADQIFVLADGQLAEQGTHHDLLTRGGLYASLWQNQSGQGAESSDRPYAIDSGQLRQIPLFVALDSALLDTLAQRLTGEWHAPGSEIVVAGARGDRLFIVAQGEVRVLAPGATRASDPLATLGVGDYFGEIALLRDVPRTATILAATPVLTYSLQKADFLDLLEETPGLQVAVERTLLEREAALEADLRRADDADARRSL